MRGFWNWLKRLFQRAPRPAPIPPPPPPPPPVEPPPPPKPPLLYGFYYDHSERWGDFSEETREKTNLFVVENKNEFQSVSDEPGGLYFPKMRAYLLREQEIGAARKFFFDLGLHQSDILIRKSLGEVQPYQHRLTGVILADEPDWSVADLERKLRIVRAEMDSQGFNLSIPLGVVLSEGQIEGEKLHEAEGLDFVGCEVYLEAALQDSDTPDEVRRKVAWYRAAIPGDKRILWIGQGYDRNGAWRNAESLAAIQFPIYEAIIEDSRTLGLLYFAYGRPGGVRDSAALRAQHARIWDAVNGR